jgi:NTE family protein
VDIGVVLSGGGARCLAQIGALKALEEHGLRITAISANSSAAILGALYAAGHEADRIVDIVKNIDFKTFFDPDGRGGLIGHAGVEALLREHAPETFEELVIPLAVPAVDIQSAEMLVLKSGPLVPAVCASNAFPGLFTPVEHLGRYLMDGGILNNVPVDVIRTMTTAPVVVVDVRPSPRERIDFGEAGFWERLTAPFSADQPMPVTVMILMKAYTITQARLIELRYAMYPPDYMIAPELDEDFHIQEFDRFEEAHELGYQKAKEVLKRTILKDRRVSKGNA